MTLLQVLDREKQNIKKYLEHNLGEKIIRNLREGAVGSRSVLFSFLMKMG